VSDTCLPQRQTRGRILALAAVLALPACVVPSRQQLHMNTSEAHQLVTQLTAQAHQWDQAIVRKDRAAIEANMAEDFRQIDGAGNVETRQSFVDDLMSPALQIAPYFVEDFDVRLYGDVALLSGRTRMTGHYDGKAFSSHYRYIDVYVRRGTDWQIVSVQISKIVE
jgi:ketosteroid isomerase-like protein